MDPAALRIIDANLNRAREALRVLEEHARLALNDAALTERAKRLRHELADVGGAFGPDEVLAARDIQHDVGTRVSTKSERQRADTADVAAAAAKRASEALRCLEEYGKTVSVGAAARIEQLRYAVYALEQSIFVAGPRRRRLRQASLHVLLTEALCNGPWLSVAEQAIAGGADAIQLREKTLSDRELLGRAGALRDMTRRLGALLIINDRPDIARLADADGVHVGQDDLPVSAARHIVGPNRIVGKSTHDIEQAQAALAENPDYVAVGPMFASPTKPRAEVPGPALLAAVAAFVEVPVIAIGGITADNVAELHAGPATLIAVCQAVIAAKDVAAAARAIKERMAARARGASS